jgi:hypothetical protein
MHNSLSRQDLARERHAQLLRNASIRYVATVSYSPASPAGPEPERPRRGSFSSLLRRAALAGG